MKRQKKIFYIKGVKFCVHKGFVTCLEPILLDCETSNNHAEKSEDLITWISSIQVLFHGKYYLLRKPEELIEFYKYLYDELEMQPVLGQLPKKVITFIHNASYDLSYLIPYFDAYLPHHNEKSQGIIDSPNKFLNYQQAGFEWRCTYRLTNMSLEKWSNEMNVEHKKQVGLYNYDKIIFQDDELDKESQLYDYYDVLSMSECLEKQNQYHGDNIATMPLTFTGYVRRELRESCKSNKYFRNDYFYKTQMSAELYYALLKSYAGGMTHNNRFYNSMVIKAGGTYDYLGKKIYVPMIGHADFKSHYPSQMACYDFPLGVPQCIYDIDYFDNNIFIDDILSYYPKYSTISVIRFFNVEIKNKRISMPFMQRSKCHFVKFTRERIDNGRIIYASGEWVLFLDNLTLDIIRKQYEFSNDDYEVLKVWRVENKPLPPEILNVVDKYFKGKSDKKNIVNDLVELFGKLDEKTLAAEFDLKQTKTALNSLYGVFGTNPLRQQYGFRNGLEFYIKQDYETFEDIEKGLNEYYSKRQNFCPYIIGCYVTALARHELFEYIEKIGYDKVLYVDTDSAFYIKDDETIKAINELNEEKRNNAHFVTLENDKREYYDSFNSEPDCYAFKGLHSKCYGVVTDHGLELTIAGVPARTLVGMKDNIPQYVTRESELSDGEIDPIKALDKLDGDAIFHINTGISAIYVGATGNNTPRVPTILNIDGHEISTAGGCVLRKLESKKVKDTDYDLLSYEYENYNPVNYDY